MNLLSVDWDYFFPCADWYDWGHSENRQMYLEFLWHVRAGNVHLKTGKLALDQFVPRERELSTFWNTVCPSTNLLLVADSHSDIQVILRISPGDWTVWNFDAHHDIRYGAKEKNPKYRCDNWVDVGTRKKGQRVAIAEYNLVYPKWRKKDKETILDDFPVNVFYGIPDDLPEFDAVFICRSSAWIPTWWDARWIKFIEYWKKKNRMLWDNKVSCEFALKVRSPNMEEARELAVEQIRQREDYLKQFKGKNK